MIDYRNRHSASHIVTIEDPIEFLHTNQKSIVNQREVGLDTHSYSRALRSAVREAPDVVLIGEIRERETMQAALDLAGTGHLAIATLHANNAPETLDRIINMYPNDQHNQVLMDLAQYIRAIISQRLVRSKEGKRVAAVEVMLNSPHISDIISKGDIAGVKEAFKETRDPGMQTFDEALFNLYRKGEISMEEALSNADSRSNLEAKINFG
jgi:twitching motility protein PilU